MSEEYNKENENEVKDDHVSELHKNQDIPEVVDGKDIHTPTRTDSPYSVVFKAIPIAFGMAGIAIIITVVLYWFLK